MPGFNLAFGYTLMWLSLIVLMPLAALVTRASGIGWDGFAATVFDARVIAGLRTSFGISLAAASVDACFGLLIAWVLVRYTFPCRKLLDAAVDLPFALPTAVAGIALASVYAPNGSIGSLVAPLGMKIAFTPLGIFFALIFVGLPFSVRTVQPLIIEMDRELEEAAATLGASRTRAVWTVLIPPLVPAILTGFALSFARAVGEYGSVIFVAGNIPYVSEIAPLLIVIKLEEFNYSGATAIATIMMAISFATLLAVNALQAYSRRRFGHA
jgi:sulfate transport system permease protein